MADLKTKVTDASVADYIASRASEEQQADCQTLMAIFRKVTQQPPKMWGPSIVGYGSYRYTYESGRTGEMCLTGFAIRGRELVLYLAVDSAEQQALLSQLGKHKLGKSCVSLKRLSEVDQAILESLIVGSIKEIEHRYGRDSTT